MMSHIMKSMSTLAFRRIEAGKYQADSATKRYLVSADAKARCWKLTIFPLAEQSGIKHTIGVEPEARTDAHDTKGIVIAIARAYDFLGDEYQSHLNGHVRRITRAVLDAYETA